MFTLTIAVCTFNRQKYLAELLESLKNQSSADNLFEIVVINNNSADNTIEVCQNFKKKNPDKNFKYFTENRQGLSFARNRALAESSGKFIVFVDDDAYVNTNYAENILKFLSKNSQAKIIGGKIIPVYENKPKWISPFLEPIFGKLDLGKNTALFTGKKFPFGGNSGAAKEIFEKYGNYNTELGRKGEQMLASEEKDFFERLKTAGEKIYYLPDMILFHHAPALRTTPEFIMKQAIGIGKSEKLRAEQNGISGLGKLHLTEFKKWLATIAISTIYFFSGKFAKAAMLIKFRFWVSKGIFGKN